MSWEILAIVAALCLAMPFFLQAIGRGDYDRDEGMSVEDWKKVWRFITRQGGKS